MHEHPEPRDRGGLGLIQFDDACATSMASAAAADVCMPLQSQYAVDRVSRPDNFCNAFSSKSLKLPGGGKRMKAKVAGNDVSGCNHIDQDVENGEILGDKLDGEEDFEEGELRISESKELDNEDTVIIRGDLEAGEIAQDKKPIPEPDHTWPKRGSGKDEIVKHSSRNKVQEVTKFRPWRGSRDDIERSEYNLSRSGKVKKNDYNNGKEQLNPGWRGDHGLAMTSAEYTNEDCFRRSGYGQQCKLSARLDQAKDSKFSTKILHDETSSENEHNNDTGGKEFSYTGQSKRHVSEPDNHDYRRRGESGDSLGNKSRKLDEDSLHSGHPDHYSRRFLGRHSNGSSFKVSSERYSSRHFDSSRSSKGSFDRHGSSPGPPTWSPHGQPTYRNHYDRSSGHRARSPCDIRERSPYDRREKLLYDTRERSPYDKRERSPYDSRERSQNNWVERSAYDKKERYQSGRKDPHQEDMKERSMYNRNSSQKRISVDLVHGHRNCRDRTPPDPSIANSDEKDGDRRKGCGKEGREEVIRNKDSVNEHSRSSKGFQDMKLLLHGSAAFEGMVKSQHPEEQSTSKCNSDCNGSATDNGHPEEPLSMEEDMDICDTPPHVSAATDSETGKWVYLDYLGAERGPSKLSELKEMVETGDMWSDHLIKHMDSDRWVTVENAASPLVIVNFAPMASSSVTQLVNPPEAPGNVLTDAGNSGHDYDKRIDEKCTLDYSKASSISSEANADLYIDERVEALLEGVVVLPGRELEILEEVLQVSFEGIPWERYGTAIDHLPLCQHTEEKHDQESSRFPKNSDILKEDSLYTAPQDSSLYDDSFFAEWFPWKWSCKGGDWKRDDGSVDDRSQKILVLNDGVTLCQMPKSGYEDPRWQVKDELYYPSSSQMLDLPCWGFSGTDDNSDSMSIRNQVNQAATKGGKGVLLPVVKINACVVKDHGPSVAEPQIRSRGRERYSSKSSRLHSAAKDAQRSSVGGSSSSKTVRELDPTSDLESRESIKHPKDHLCTANDLELHFGDWYYQDGSGYERGPLTLAELESLVYQGVIHRSSCVFRKFDNLWVPITSALMSSGALGKTDSKKARDGKLFDTSLFSTISASSETNLSSFNSSYPQFIGYTLGKLHELVMKSYKSREFAAAINEVLDPWISAKQLKEAEKNLFIPAITKSSSGELNRFQSSDGNHGAIRARVKLLEHEEENYVEGTVAAENDSELSFDELCAGAKFNEEETSDSAPNGTWGLLNGHILSRIFHFLKADLKSLAFASQTCKKWRSAVRFYKSISRQVDLSSVAPICTDCTTWQILDGYDREKITNIVLAGCVNVSSSTVEQILLSFPSLSILNIRGCRHLHQLESRFHTVNWSNNWSSGINKTNLNTKSTQRTIEKTSTTSEDDFDHLKDYFDSVDRRESASQLFRQSLYRRSKVFDARKSSSILPRDARVRRWALKKSEIDYKKAEKFITLTLREIMKENTFDFLVPKVEEIEEKIKSGYYVNRGLRSVKEDLSRICKDANKRKHRGEAGNFNHVIKLFVRLANRLDRDSKMMKNTNVGDDSSAGLLHAASKYKKKLTSVDKEYISRSNSVYSIDGGLEEYSSSRDFSRRFLKLNKKLRNSGSDSSDDFDQSSEHLNSDSESSASETKSGFEFWSETSFGELKGSEHYGDDDAYESVAYEREWGARMTKASLVPPVTRKYEVIDHYVIVADEEEVRRKMQVSLPEDYSEKLKAQKSSNEDLDMEIPEVKDFQPRKTLGDEVLEQEVYGIDPYTHNLVLDTMPEELDWSLIEKHLFIEDVVLRTLNKQVRRFTGSGSTPMMYSLKPVIEEIQKTAIEARDLRTMRMCQGILKAMASRPDDKYVAYRKGLGVVCNKDGGFGVDDFIVDFLGEVYPAWRWFEKQDGIRYLQKNSTDPAPEFYNIYLERPKGDADGYDLVVVDAMHKANYASRICHSCRPNCEAKVTAVDGHYQIGIYAVREIQYGEEISFDYNSVTESKEEYEVSVCLCGSQVCRGSYLNLTGEGAFEMVLEEWHGILDRHKLMIQACELNYVSEKDYIVLGKAGLGSCLLAGLPDWLIAYTARLVRFINMERIKLPDEILKHNVEEKRKYLTEISLDVEKSDAEIQAEGVYNQRLQNLALTLDKVRYVMRCVFGDPKRAPPPLEKLSPRSVVSAIWKGESSLVEELLQCMAPYTDDYLHNDLRRRIHAHDPSDSDDVHEDLCKSLLWLRDELRTLPCSYKCRHDAAADLIHICAYTKSFFRIQEYKAFTSPPIYISPLDLGPKYSEKMGTGLLEYQKTYGSNYCLGQLMNWYNQTNAEPDRNLVRASKGCLVLPDISSFYANPQKPSRQRINGPRALQFMLSRMEKQAQRVWPEDRVWACESTPNVVGSPMLDAILENSPVNKEMMHWLKNRATIYEEVSD
uniref:SET domain-containing protein n=1 Tax=Kalanchoe fedtschenkoi TaxID=63787 RepID=A0A7N0TFX8_KALFE